MFKRLLAMVASNYKVSPQISPNKALRCAVVFKGRVDTQGGMKEAKDKRNPNLPFTLDLRHAMVD